MTETSLPLTPPTKRLRANSRGEELYFVHLQRMTAPDPHPEDAEDDHDYETPRKSEKTIGEELFEVYLKRSQGLQPDYDVDPDAKGSDEKPAAKEEKVESESKAHHNLRTRKDKMAE
mmetsp:Transcript_21302/g.38561  ORF Transcript_21302/g.38561 Transcript_21302/m.38561 type:complete len:117 (-) Transcript_21302:1302-1652(-)